MKEFKLPRITTQITTHIATQVKLLLGCIIFALAIGLVITLAIAFGNSTDFNVVEFESKVTTKLQNSIDKDIWMDGIKKDYDLELISVVASFKVHKVKEELNTLFTILGIITITADCRDQSGLSKQVVSIRYMALLVSSDYEIIESKILSIIPMRVIGYGTEG